MTERRRVVLGPVRNVLGTVSLPGDKSISHRYAMLGAIADGTTRLENFSTGADCASTLACLRALGVKWRRNQNVLTIHGCGPQLKAPAAPLDCGNSGSTMRMLSGILAGQHFSSDLTGDVSLSRRPMQRIIQPLEAMGARFSANAGGRPPLHIIGNDLKAIDYKLPVASAQVKTCILMAGLFAEGETCVEEPLPTRDHGELALRAFGAELKTRGREARIAGGQRLHGIDATIPGDISSASFFLCAAALFPGSQLAISGVLLNPTRARLLDVLSKMGVGVSITQVDESYGELVGTVQVEGRTLKGTLIAGSDTAALIDELPVLAAIAAYTDCGIEIRDAHELRIKETDRIAAVARNVRAMGGKVEEFEDGMKISGGQALHGADLDSCGDHRIAMAFSVAALRAQGETRIKNADIAVISYPGFFDALDSVVQR